MKTALALFIPMILSNFFHMVIIKKNYLKEFKIPINQKLFGPNKTWRGMLVMMNINGFFHFAYFALVHGESTGSRFIQGSLLGLAYILAELPNSWFKRKQGIPSGQTGQPAWLYRVLDKADSASAVVLVWMIWENLPFDFALLMFVMAFSLHMSLSYFVYRIGLKEAL
jgi:hypothetical protein